MRHLEHNLGALMQPIKAVGHDYFISVEAFADSYKPALSSAGGNGPGLNTMIWFDYIDEGTLGIALQRGDRNQYSVTIGTNKHTDVDELIGKEGAVEVIE